MTFDIFASHEKLAWFSNYFDRFPALPSISILSRLSTVPSFRGEGQKGIGYEKSLVARPRVRPAETYSVWKRYGRSDFNRDYLLGVHASEVERDRLRKVVASVVKYHGKSRFANKLTGPSRIEYINSVFPDALFVHIVRDGRAVVNSLLNIEFWKRNGGLTKPYWLNGFPDDFYEAWSASQFSPMILAALQWKRMVSLARADGRELGISRFLEVRYEDFMRNPAASLNLINCFCGLESSASQFEYLRTRVEIQEINSKHLHGFTPDELQKLDNLLSPELADFGYV